MIKKTKHPSNRGERLALKVKKDRLHVNASPVFKLLKEKEELDAVAEKKKSRVLSPRRHSSELDRSPPPAGVPD